MFDDKRLEYRVMKVLSERGIPFTLLNNTIDFQGVVLSDVPLEKAVVVDDALEAFRRVSSILHGKERFIRLIVGIDPGPKPGIAVVGDGEVIEEMHLDDVSKVRAEVDAIYSGYRPYRMTIRIGDGDIVNRNRIVNTIVDDYEVELVDERNTTTSITNRDVVSARNIAHTRGRIIRKRLNTVIREGYIREIQRRSRIESSGRVTIPMSLAKRVALGEISLERAIMLTREEHEQ